MRIAQERNKAYLCSQIKKLTKKMYRKVIVFTALISATYSGMQAENTYRNSLALMDTSKVVDLDEVVVVADAKTQSGAATNFSANSIENTPTVDRNIYDIVKNSPLAMTSKNGGITFVGSNNRYNSFQIDGTVANDVFGRVRRALLRPYE
jgi:hypothetical protein